MLSPLWKPRLLSSCQFSPTAWEIFYSIEQPLPCWVHHTSGNWGLLPWAALFSECRLDCWSVPLAFFSTSALHSVFCQLSPWVLWIPCKSTSHLLLCFPASQSFIPWFTDLVFLLFKWKQDQVVVYFSFQNLKRTGVFTCTRSGLLLFAFRRGRWLQGWNGCGGSVPARFYPFGHVCSVHVVPACIISRSPSPSSHRLSIRPSVSCKSCSRAGYGNNCDQLPVHPLESLALVSLLRFNATFPSSLTTWPKCSSG